jgi:hypothetical protein
MMRKQLAAKADAPEQAAAMAEQDAPPDRALTALLGGAGSQMNAAPRPAPVPAAEPPAAAASPHVATVSGRDGKVSETTYQPDGKGGYGPGVYRQANATDPALRKLFEASPGMSGFAQDALTRGLDQTGVAGTKDISHYERSLFGYTPTNVEEKLLARSVQMQDARSGQQRIDSTDKDVLDREKLKNNLDVQTLQNRGSLDAANAKNHPDALRADAFRAALAQGVASGLPVDPVVAARNAGAAGRAYAEYKSPADAAATPQTPAAADALGALLGGGRPSPASGAAEARKTLLDGRDASHAKAGAAMSQIQGLLGHKDPNQAFKLNTTLDPAATLDQAAERFGPLANDPAAATEFQRLANEGQLGDSTTLHDMLTKRLAGLHLDSQGEQIFGADGAAAGSLQDREQDPRFTLMADQSRGLSSLRSRFETGMNGGLPYKQLRTQDGRVIPFDASPYRSLAGTLDVGKMHNFGNPFLAIPGMIRGEPVLPDLPVVDRAARAKAANERIPHYNALLDAISKKQ